MNTHKGYWCLVLFMLLNVCCSAQQPNCNDTWYEGDGTQYGGVAGGAGGHCGIPVASGDIYHAAMNHEQYAGSNACGSCVRIIGPKGIVVLKIVDECPECKYGDIDMTTAVFPQLADLKDGRIPIKWQYVPCPLVQDITMVFAAGSGPYYFKVQLRDFFYPIVKLEYRKTDGTYADIHREVYNYFVAPSGIDEDKQKTGPYAFRVTAITGQVLYIPEVVFSTAGPVHTGAQFDDLKCPDCAGIAGGTAAIDNCGVCSGGTTGIPVNASCSADCAGYWEGTAYTDGCGHCVSGTTGATPCGNDCHGDPGGQAYPDNCGTCVGGNTGLSPCTKDCANEWGGTAFVDSCKACAGGHTSVTPSLQKNNCGITTAISVGEEEDRFSVCPNPFDTYIQISRIPDAWLRLTDINGRILIEKQGTEEYLETDWLPKGIYMLYIHTEQHIRIVRMEK